MKHMQYGMFAVLLVIFGLIFWRRTRAMVRPIRGSGLRILLPLLYMSPAFSVVIQPSVHMTTIEIIFSVIFGIILSIPLIYTTGYEIREDGKIYAKKSIGFVIALIIVFVSRRLSDSFLPGIDALTLNALSIISLFVYVGLWRIISFMKFKKVYNSQVAM
ncbi:CcdC protein domain-containing protein [Bacillus sp. HNG]|uniref:CcdC protein domain-containing protein n=1 Tax=Bacillus sp. HNG TaxID=2293325 RepID=UPI001CB96607|nr:CcdC protein domain-containing protein [Bacillus sp. HNG]